MILLLSGGIDSFVAYHFLGKPKTVYFDLNTPYSEKEIQIVRKMDPSITIDTTLQHLGSTQIGDKAYVPFRNLYLAMSAVRYDDDVVIAGIKGDDVADKNKQAFSKMSALLTELEGRMITVMSPFWEMTKEEIVSWYDRSENPKIDWVNDTISCYSHNDVPYCGECPCCFRKWVALVNNGYDIPFYNKELVHEYVMAAMNHKYIPERNEAILNAITTVGIFKCAMP